MKNKDKNSLKQKIVIAIACLVIVACTITMTTMAWFTDSMEGTTNLTFGKIKLSDDYTTYTFNANNTGAVASRVINGGDWTVVMDETSNDAFVRLLVKYGVPTKAVATEDNYYLVNKAYYKYEDNEYVRLVVDTDYTVGDEIVDKTAVFEYEYALEYISSGTIADNMTLAKISEIVYFTQYHKVYDSINTSALLPNFVKGVKYYAVKDGVMTRLYGSTEYDISKDYVYGAEYTDANEVFDAIYTDVKYVAGTTYAIVDGVLVAADEGAGITGTIGTEANDAVGIDDTDTNRYTIYNAYIDWVITNVTLPETPTTESKTTVTGTYTQATEFVDGTTYYTEASGVYTVAATQPTESTDFTAETFYTADTQTYAFHRVTEDDITGEVKAGTAAYYLTEAYNTNNLLTATRTNEAGDINNYVFAEEGSIKISNDAEQITLHSATPVAGTVEAPANVVLRADGLYYQIEADYVAAAGEETFYVDLDRCLILNGHVYFLNQVNGTDVTVKYAQHELEIVMEVDIQALQTILSRKEATDKISIAIVPEGAEDANGVVDYAGKLGVYVNGELQCQADIENLDPFFVAQFDDAE